MQTKKPRATAKGRLSGAQWSPLHPPMPSRINSFETSASALCLSGQAMPTHTSRHETNLVVQRVPLLSLHTHCWASKHPPARLYTRPNGSLRCGRGLFRPRPPCVPVGWPAAHNSLASPANHQKPKMMHQNTIWAARSRNDGQQVSLTGLFLVVCAIAVQCGCVCGVWLDIKLSNHSQ